MTDIIVGWNPAGILCGLALRKNGIEFTGLEPQGKQDDMIVLSKILQQESTEILRKWIPELSSSKTKGNVLEWQKGQWSAVDPTDPKAPYPSTFASDYFEIKPTLSEILGKETSEIQNRFQFAKEIKKISTTKKLITCSDGTELSYERLFWCDSYEKFIRVSNAKRIQKIPLNNFDTGFALSFHSDNAQLKRNTTSILPFRYKDKKLQAVGEYISFGSDPDRYRWSVFLEGIETGDKEEVAKCIRSLKRELEREFPGLLASASQEKITYFRHPSEAAQEPTPTLEVAPSVFIAGPMISPVSQVDPASPFDSLIQCLHGVVGPPETSLQAGF